MTNSKSTKWALVSSVLAILVCVAMLFGTTFAWFTDTASTGVNKIQAGNLKMEVSYKNASVSAFTALNESTNVFMENALWEPGHVEYAVLKVENIGTLALKYKLGINIASETGSTNVLGNEFKLSDYIKFAVIDGEANVTDRDALVAEAETANSKLISAGNYSKESHLDTTGASKTVTLVVWMPTDVGNNANYKVGKTAPKINLGINVVATQHTYESDSFNNTYDEDATYPSYPSGVTAASFEAATSVEYTNNLGQTVTGQKPAVAAYVDSEGTVKYVGDISAAVNSGAKEIYCKQNTTLRMRERLEDTNRSPDLADNLTIYANGADFQYGEISMNMTAAGKASPITLKVYDAKNIKVWGATPNDGVTQTIVMENCTNIGAGRTGDKGILMYITGNTGTVNATVKDCYVTANSSGIYMSTNGSLTVTGSTFVDCATGIKSSYKGAGTRTDRIENCVFTNCGCTAEMAGDTAWLKDDSAAYKYKNSGTGTISLTIKGNTITGTIGDKGDTQIASNVTVINE